MATTPLGRFLQTQLDARGELASDFAERSGLGLSHVYQILRGERGNVRKDTLEKIARGFDMTVPQMMTAIDPSLSDDDPFVALAHARHENQQLKRILANFQKVLAPLTFEQHAQRVAV